MGEADTMLGEQLVELSPEVFILDGDPAVFLTPAPTVGFPIGCNRPSAQAEVANCKGFA